MKRFISLFLIVALFTCSLVGCGSHKDNSDITANDSNQSSETKESVMTGVVNRIDDYLVVLDDEGNYLKFKVDGISLDGFTEGDEVNITYTGTLSEDSEDLVAKDIVKK
ncbi:hypothetical protein [Clostridium butyricum]|uniref:hypothetical protein n=1 Tax=Clostridium butyricum TaxID=1492 RepID=UPI00374FD4AA